MRRSAVTTMTMLLTMNSMFLVARTASAQLSGSNLFEFQAGNLPFAEPADLTTGYDQLNLMYREGDIVGAVRVEAFQTPESDHEYTSLSQYRLTYRTRRTELNVGHFYDILGRGLLLRAYEIPGVVFEDIASRVRRGFYRDVRGVSVRYSGDRVSAGLVRGRPLSNVLAPTINGRERRPDLIEAAEIGLRIGGVTVGGQFLRNNTERASTNFASLSVSSFVGSVSGYVEYARSLDDRIGIADFGDDSRYAAYASIAYARGAFGLSVEGKDYHNFFLGSGFNDPPSLVREQSYVVLNRSTHVLNVIDERGLQLEGYHTSGGMTLTANATIAENKFDRRYLFRELFLELVARIDRDASLKLFADAAEDAFRLERKRLSAGGYVSAALNPSWSTSVGVEGQRFSRSGDVLAGGVTNFVVSVSLDYSARYSVGITAERTDDPFLTDNPTTPEFEVGARYWFGVTGSRRPTSHHTAAVFAGRRRGGPACTSGICYEVLDFNGVEVRLTSRF